VRFDLKTIGASQAARSRASGFKGTVLGDSGWPGVEGRLAELGIQIKDQETDLYDSTWNP